MVSNEVSMVAGMMLAVVASICGWRSGGGRWVMPAMVGVLASLGYGLVVFGVENGGCPSVHPVEKFVYAGWALSLIYLFVGRDYRMSALGAWTAPLVVLLCLVAIVGGWQGGDSGDGGAAVREIGLHGYYSFGLIGVASFLLAGLAAVLWEVQNRRLKRHKLSGAMGEIPPVRQLEVAVGRLAAFGVGVSAMAWAFLAWGGLRQGGEAFRQLEGSLAIAVAVAGGFGLLVFRRIWGLSARKFNRMLLVILALATLIWAFGK